MKVEAGLAIEENEISGFIMQILNALPQIAAILNSKKIVFANEALIPKIQETSKSPGNFALLL
ncbi:MAG TPA: hypothetical protein VIK14_00365 [Ignavibacteria bacterium]